jgi:hypothetical protein
MWFWKWMEKIGWKGRVRNEEVLVKMEGKRMSYREQEG